MSEPVPPFVIVMPEQKRDIEELKRGGDPGQRIIKDTQADVAEWGDKTGIYVDEQGRQVDVLGELVDPLEFGPDPTFGFGSEFEQDPAE